MKQIDLDKIKQRNERILILLAELHSTLDLYYEHIENDVFSTKQ